MTTIEDIIRIAINAHDGMKDMVGNPAVAHVLAVGLMGKNPLEQKGCILYDVLEESDNTLGDLWSAYNSVSDRRCFVWFNQTIFIFL